MGPRKVCHVRSLLTRRTKKCSRPHCSRGRNSVLRPHCYRVCRSGDPDTHQTYRHGLRLPPIKTPLLSCGCFFADAPNHSGIRGIQGGQVSGRKRVWGEDISSTVLNTAGTCATAPEWCAKVVFLVVRGVGAGGVVMFGFHCTGVILAGHFTCSLETTTIKLIV